MNKRYAIVRVDNSCPAMVDDFGCIIARNILHCKCGEDAKNYGDTKKQLVMKVAQVIRRYRKNLEVCDYCDMKDEFEIAEKVVEFLGVEE